jgi:hypothetical protein
MWTVKVPKKLPPEDIGDLLPEGEAHTTLFNPDMESPRAELGQIYGISWLFFNTKATVNVVYPPDPLIFGLTYPVPVHIQ